MKEKVTISTLLLAALFMALAPTIMASTTWYVNGVSGSDSNNCTSPSTACQTIGHAISLASSGDLIRVASATYTENLTISISLKVIGSGASTTIVDGGGVDLVVRLPTTTATVTLSGLTIRNGRAHSGEGGGVYNSGTLTITSATISGNRTYPFPYRRAGDGGGIYNVGTLTINNSTVSGNSADGSCYFYGRFQLSCVGGHGGGIYTSGTLTINHSTVSGNVAQCGSYCYIKTWVGGGGGIYTSAKVTINNSTISGNVARCTLTGSCGRTSSWFGGGISSYGALTISNSTISGNVAQCADTFFCNSGISWVGGGISSYSALTISNSTISGNSARTGGGINGVATLQNSIVAYSQGGNCSGTMTSNGFNLSSDGTCNFNNTGDLNNTDPMLGPLQNNGGPTQTMALPSGSPAIDAGNPNGCTDGQGHLLKTDQRGMPRPDKEDAGSCDIGAYERQSD